MVKFTIRGVRPEFWDLTVCPKVLDRSDPGEPEREASRVKTGEIISAGS
jgi:hypothetical protein